MSIYVQPVNHFKSPNVAEVENYCPPLVYTLALLTKKIIGHFRNRKRYCTLKVKKKVL